MEGGLHEFLCAVYLLYTRKKFVSTTGINYQGGSYWLRSFLLVDEACLEAKFSCASNYIYFKLKDRFFFFFYIIIIYIYTKYKWTPKGDSKFPIQSFS